MALTLTVQIQSLQAAITRRIEDERANRPDLHGMEYPYLLPNRTAASISI